MNPVRLVNGDVLLLDQGLLLQTVRPGHVRITSLIGSQANVVEGTIEDFLEEIDPQPIRDQRDALQTLCNRLRQEGAVKPMYEGMFIKTLNDIHEMKGRQGS